MRFPNRIIFPVATIAIACLALAQVQRTLTINGKVSSTDVRIINGRAYAPIADIAKSLDCVVTTKGNTYELTRAGGSGQLIGLLGKAGDWLFDGGWRFRVTKVYRTQEFQAVNDYYGDNLVSAEENQELIIVDYSYRNGNKTLQPFCIGATALAGPEGDAWAAFTNDFPFDGSRWFSKVLLPGAEGKGSLVFRVKPGLKPKDLVLTMGELAGYDDAVRPKSPSVFRISLPETE